MENNNTTGESIQQREFMSISKKIDAIKINIEKPLGGILAYTPNQINKSFFPENIEKVTQKEIDNAIFSLNSYMIQFKEIAKEVAKSTFLNEVQKNIFIGTLKTYCLKIILFKYAVYIEGEKGGYELNEKDKVQYLKNIEKIESLVYGPKISERKEESAKIMSRLDNLYTKNNDKITPEEQESFKIFLDNFSERSGNEKEENIDKSKFGKLNQENIAKLFKKGLELYEIKSNIVKISDKITEVKEENGVLYIPAINKETEKNLTKSELEKIYEQFGYKKDVLKIKISKCAAIEVNIPEKEINIPVSINYYSTIRALELLSHEEITHVVTGINKENKFNIEADSYLELQEGVAMLNEKAVTTDIKDISAEPTIHHISTFIAENYNAEDTKKLLSIYYKLTGKKNAETMANNRTERVKRFHSNDKSGANRKDVVYRRGMKDVLDYIQNLDPKKIEDIKELQKNIFNFHIGKLGKEEVKNAQELIEGFDIRPDNIILPADFGKILLKTLEKATPEGKGIKINNETLGENDIRFLASLPEQNLNYQQKKLLLEIRDFIKGNAEISNKE